MKIDLYTITWNEQRLLPFFLEYYVPWIDRLIVFDDKSDDGTAEVLARHPKVDLRTFPPKGESFVLAALGVWENVWKESRGRADWVVVTNIDEFIFHPAGMRGYLERCATEGITMVHPRGYEMVGDVFPDPGKSLVKGVRRGVPMFGQDKRQVFNPNAITDINYTTGRHQCRPTGTVVEPSSVEAALLHYKYVCPHAYLMRRQRALARRMLDGDMRSGFGTQYRQAPAQLLNSFEWLKLHATEVVPGDVAPAHPV